ncbi:hypothetical protein BGZ65_003169 [Modicella reniformis]|uniref:Uncharacterized protein n=1 Tax=Modicella reniformis TaxID=1440133 RepID=A0A9P6SVQ7_9FUNG|nr:hypothetical protein BGZ65_003169 [Modicella reniformis]
MNHMHTNAKLEQLPKAEQARRSRLKSIAAVTRSAHGDRSPSPKAETEEKVKKDDDDHIKTEEIEKIGKRYMLSSPDGAVNTPATEDQVSQLDPSSRSLSHDGMPCHHLLTTKVPVGLSEGNQVSNLGICRWGFSRSAKTRGERTQESARLIGEARYDIILQHGHSHLVYQLEVPREPSCPRRVQHLERETVCVQVKNPKIQTPGTQQEKFRGIRKDWVRFTALDTIEFLDIRHVEIVLFCREQEAMEAQEAEIEEEEKGDHVMHCLNSE